MVFDGYVLGLGVHDYIFKILMALVLSHRMEMGGVHVI